MYDDYSEANSRCANSLQRIPMAIFKFFCLHSYNFYYSVAAMFDCIVQACSVAMSAISGHDSDFNSREKNSPKHKHLIGFAILSSTTQAFDWLRYFHFAMEQKQIQLPGEEKYFAEKHSKIMLRSIQPFHAKFFAFRSLWNWALMGKLCSLMG